jgi:hypothetical protein
MVVSAGMRRLLARGRFEGRPDSSQPVQGNLGFKQRTAVVAPAKRVAGGDARSDAASMISSFRIKRDGKKGWWAPVVIRSALVTGTAATKLKPPQAQDIAAVVGGSARFVTTDQRDLQSAIDAIDARGPAAAADYERAARILPEDFQKLYDDRHAKGLPERVAFLSAKNNYLESESTAGQGPRFRQVVEALRAAVQ